MLANEWILAAEVLEVEAILRLIEQARAELARRGERGAQVSISNVQTGGGDYAEGEIRK